MAHMPVVWLSAAFQLVRAMPAAAVSQRDKLEQTTRIILTRCAPNHIHGFQMQDTC